jgi:hypothetical protein
MAITFGVIGWMVFHVYSTRGERDQREFLHSINSTTSPSRDVYSGKQWVEANGVRMECREDIILNARSVACREKCIWEYAPDGRAINDCLSKDRGYRSSQDEIDAMAERLRQRGIR